MCFVAWPPAQGVLAGLQPLPAHEQMYCFSVFIEEWYAPIEVSIFALLQACKGFALAFKLWEVAHWLA